MPLPVLLKYIYDHATHEVIRQGKAIYATGGAKLLDADPLQNTATFRVTNDSHPVTYQVDINKYKDAEDLSVQCQCTYDMGEICRHEAAALFQLQDLFDKNLMDETTAQYNQKLTEIKMKDIDPKTLRLLTSRKNFIEAEKIARHHQAAIKYAKEECVRADLAYQKKIFPLELKRNPDRNFETSCNCDETEHPLCKHKAALFLQLLNSYGTYYFDTIKNWDKQKNKLLEQYGYSLSDDLKGKFEFVYTNGKPFLRVLDPSIKRIANRPAARPENKQYKTFVTTRQPKKAIVLPQGVRSRNLKGGIDNYLSEQKNKKPNVNNRLGVVISTAPDAFPHLQVDLVIGEVNDSEDLFVGTVQKLELSKYIDYYSYSREDRELIAPIRKLQAAELNKYLNRNSNYAGLWEHLYIDKQNENAIPQDTQKLILEYIYARLKRLFPLLETHPLTYQLPANTAYRSANLLPAEFKAERFSPEFEVKKENGKLYLSCHVNMDGTKVPMDENESRSPLLFLHKGKIALVKSVRDAMVLQPYQTKNPVVISEEAWPKHLEADILPLSQKYKVHFSPSLVEKSDKIKPQPYISFKELNNLLLIQPLFQYNNEIVEWDNGAQITTIAGDKVLLVKRDKEAEEAFIQTIRKSHTHFERPTNHNYFHLQSREALSQNWFLNFMDLLQENKVHIKGLSGLKKFRFNKNRPVTKLEISSDIDWFDAKVAVTFGEQAASIKEIKRALSRRQNFIPLKDGSLGILPEQWMEKYGLLFRMGQESPEGGLQVSKYNFSIIDELYDHINDENLRKELDEKKRMLLNFEELPAIPLPAKMKAVMRNYQESGFQWLNYLDDIKWGGILADDMGLGKTLQALSFLQHFKNQNKRCFALVVCPTSLIYNWENEIKKFTPDLSYLIHHGPTRTYNTKELKQYNVLLTSYGTLRSDIQLFVKFQFDYVILDESQFIKNPNSKVTKAARLLNAANRLCLSGTPMQNNTFDIYSQMHFLNPGMLGSIDFFKNEFSQPIDKNEDEDRKAHLRKLIYPFILRRTKEQVARDLPEKSEMVLFCEMDKEQRSIYESYRHLYRSRILGTIDEQGLGRSQFTILQGLMKLRQICDSPAILKEETFDNYSVKLEELSREIRENTGNHKVLIFSQFLGMLKLIKDKLRALHIPFEYFDGSTSPAEREKAIYNFQNDEKSRVFLISLKAGGVGLNLTAADYVYIVDPWWNPAVEQQAIDRTHRIGQTKSIFAYRMICKNTIEEKILQLQEKKKSLVKDVISDENGFVKKLTKEDVLYLFS